MKLLIALTVLSISTAMPEDLYKIDVSTLDIDGFLKDTKKLKMFSNCLLDVGECNPIGAAVKSQLPQVLATGCSKCTPAHKQVIRKIILAEMQQLPEDYEKLLKKYDPAGKYKDNIEKFLASTD